MRADQSWSAPAARPLPAEYLAKQPPSESKQPPPRLALNSRLCTLFGEAFLRTPAVAPAAAGGAPSRPPLLGARVFQQRRAITAAAFLLGCVGLPLTADLALGEPGPGVSDDDKTLVPISNKHRESM